MATIVDIVNGENGLSILNKLNAVIAEANKVDSKIGNVSEDTSPQLGGALDANSFAVKLAKGADIASATNIVPLTDGNTFVVTGSTAINAIASDIWSAGNIIFLQFTGTPTITNNGTVAGINKKIILRKGANYTAVANDILMLVYDGTSWYEVNNLTKWSSKIYQTLASSAAIDMDLKLGQNAVCTLAHSTTITFTNIVNGDEGNIDIIKDATATLRNIVFAHATLPIKIIRSEANSFDLTISGQNRCFSYVCNGVDIKINYGEDYG